jgi:hypothetical protein
MFARNVSFHLKSNMLSDYTRAFDKDILPLLRKQHGFKDEITFSSPGGNDVTAISLWDNKASSEAYNSTAYPEVLKRWRGLSKELPGSKPLMLSTRPSTRSPFLQSPRTVHSFLNTREGGQIRLLGLEALEQRRPVWCQARISHLQKAPH